MPLSSQAVLEKWGPIAAADPEGRSGPFHFQRPRTRLESQGTHDHYDDARLWSTVSCECEDG